MSDTEENIVEKARKIATQAHEGQKRKSEDVPFISHPLAVATILEELGFGEKVIAAALLHDVLEDTVVSEEELRNAVGDEITNIVVAVSEDKSLEWEDRKKQYIETVASASEEVKAVSVADKIHNARDFIRIHEEYGPEVWAKFRRGKGKSIWFQRALLEELKKTWKHPMLEELETLVVQLETLD